MLKDGRAIVTLARGSAMAKLREVDLKANPEIAEAFNRLEASRGWISNLMRSIAHAPEGLQRYQALGHYARYDTELTEAQKELVVCTTVRNVSYGWEHHAPLAKQCGVTDGQLALLKAGRFRPTSPRTIRRSADSRSSSAHSKAYGRRRQRSFCDISPSARSSTWR